MIIELGDEQIVLIRRKNPPSGWALPGGFVDAGETVEQAAVREALEETSLSVELVRQFHVYSDPGRDPRGHTVSVVFFGRAEGEPKVPTTPRRRGHSNELTFLRSWPLTTAKSWRIT